MHAPALVRLVVVVAAGLAVAPCPPAPAQQRGEGGRRARPPVYRDRIQPQWAEDNASFWYRNDLADNTREFVRVDAAAGIRAPAFDHDRLAAALSDATGETHRGDRLPFEVIAFPPGGRSVRFTVGEVDWTCDLAEYTLTKTPVPAAAGEAPRPAPNRDRPPRSRPGARSGRSPDGTFEVVLRDHNIVLRDLADDAETPLTADGDEDNAYTRPQWSPDGSALVAFRSTPGDIGEVHLIESSPRGGGRAVLSTRRYALPGDPFPTHQLCLFDPTDRQRTFPEVDRLELEFGFPELHWQHDGRHLVYELIDRGHQRLRLVRVDSASGAVGCLVDEQTDTFIWTAHTENLGLQRVTYLDQTDEIIYVSELSGWRHLYLVNGVTGERSPITSGEYVVRGIDRIDEDARQVWFHAGGRHPDQDPYFVHYYRVNFDGTGLVELTEGNGTHSVVYSPDRTYLIDQYSRVDLPPVHTLRRASDGSLVCPLETADISELAAQGWQAPEPFAAKGRDGTTDIWGVLFRPAAFDPARKYPIIEQVYAGPQGAYVPKRFSAGSRHATLTDLGFVVVQIDGMGTAFRSKAFHDVCWQNLKDAGFPDRIRWHQAVAEKYPWYDTSRVGIYGVSAGGQNAAGAVLFHPDFYDVAVAASGCHDNRLDKASWNEQWMGYPVGPQYAANSNIDNAARLEGKLMLIVGELDRNVPPESTLRFVDALIRADKDFDLVYVPGAGHGGGGRYGGRRSNDFFVRHLLGAGPPDRGRASPEVDRPGKPE